MKSIHSSDFIKDLEAHLQDVAQSQEPLMVIRDGEEQAVVLLPARAFSGMQETAHLFSSVENRERLLKSIQQAEAGQTIPYDLSESTE